MSSIRNITASNPMPVDLAKRLGKGGIAELLSVMWQGYDDLHDASIITKEMNENAITEEWFLRVNEIWHQENRAARVSIHLSPITQLGMTRWQSLVGNRRQLIFVFVRGIKMMGILEQNVKTYMIMTQSI